MEMKCPKCGGETEEGKLYGGMVFVSFCKGTNFMGVPKDGEKIKAYRCKVCGYLESYAK